MNRMEQLLAFCDWERKHNPHPEGKPHVAEWAADEIERLRAALAELVAVKDLKERAEALHFAGPSGTAGDGWKDLYEAARRDYLRRQPAAWDAARDALWPNSI